MDRPEKDIPNGESHISKEVSKVQEWLRNKRDSFDHNNIWEDIIICLLIIGLGAWLTVSLHCLQHNNLSYSLMILGSVWKFQGGVG